LTPLRIASDAIAALNPSSLPATGIDGLYVHVPFCFHKCHYCDFYSITRQTPERMDRFVDLILREARLWERARPAHLLRPKTVFFGGGTPSLLPAQAMQRLLTGLGRHFDLSAVEEWTVEVNPATACEKYCQMLRGHGVDRLSFGAQSFRPDELAALERHHQPEDVPRSIELARRAGFTRLNVDLIYAIVGQDFPSWCFSLEQAIALQTPHLSCYGLTYEPNTPMGVKKRLGVIRPVEESVELQMLLHTRQRLAELGKGAYEISNYAELGEECRHNLMYWQGGNYLGLGPSAASHIEGWRWRNRPHLGEWENVVADNALPATDVEHLTPARRQGELAMLMLRLTRGIDLETFRAKTGQSASAVFAEPIDRLGNHGLIRVDGDTIRLTESGIQLADSIAGEFLMSIEG
jgi:oxygen-independent coproporphyrinogen-3 oxidase